MAEGKKSFVVYCDLIETVSKLGDEEAGKLFKHMLNYVNDLNPKAPDRITEIIFEPIKQQMKRDLVKYSEKKKVRSDDGHLGNLKRWHPDLYEKVLNKEMTQEQSVGEVNRRKTSPPDKKRRHPIKNVAKIAVIVNATVTDIVNVTDTVTKESKGIASLTLPFSSKEFLESWGKLSTTKKWKKKELTALEASLKQLSKFPEEYAIILMDRARAGNYQGVVFSDTEEQYKKHQQNGNQFTGKTQTTGISSFGAKKDSRDELSRIAISVLTNGSEKLQSDIPK